MHVHVLESLLSGLPSSSVSSARRTSGGESRSLLCSHCCCHAVSWTPNSVDLLACTDVEGGWLSGCTFVRGWLSGCTFVRGFVVLHILRTWLCCLAHFPHVNSGDLPACADVEGGWLSGCTFVRGFVVLHIFRTWMVKWVHVRSWSSGGSAPPSSVLFIAVRLQAFFYCSAGCERPTNVLPACTVVILHIFRTWMVKCVHVRSWSSGGSALPSSVFYCSAASSVFLLQCGLRAADQRGCDIVKAR